MSELPPEIDTSSPHPARIYDYGLGGKNHFAADREVADKIIESWPAVRTAGRENRAFLGRTVRYLAAEEGIRQFLDIGTGLPTTNNVHLAHAQALLTSAPEGRTAYIQADLRAPEETLASPVVRDVLDFSQPIALMLVAVLHFIQDEDKPAEIIATLLDALPPGSYLVASHVTGEHDPTGPAVGQRAYRESRMRAQVRDSDVFARLAFSGLELAPPGVVLVSEWRPEGDEPRPTPSEVSCYGGVARKQ
jgi:S-adenosyl methyltransferase